MNEGRTTAIFAGIAAVVVFLAYMSRPTAIMSELEEGEQIKGQAIFPTFDEPDKASSLEIVKYNATLDTKDEFLITKDKSGLWKIPSHDDYPADAAEQVRDAVSPLIGLRVLSVVSADRGDHELYGVINPTDENASGDGVGTLVRVKDEKDGILADVIIGKADSTQEKQHYVRRPEQDATYMVELQTEPFTTEFRKWIKSDLLGVNSFDIHHVGLRNYNLAPQNNSIVMQRVFDADLAFDPAKSKWTLDRMVTFDGADETPFQIPDNQELKESSLNELRTAAQSLKIVNVHKKPKGLAADLKADASLLSNKDSLRSLYQRGFYPQKGPEGDEIFAAGGETIIGTKDSVQYLLRFGEAVASISSESEDEKADEGSLQRYLLVTAKLDESKFPAPDLTPVPETIEELDKMDAAAKPAATPETKTEEVPPTPGTPKEDTPKEDTPKEESKPEEKPVDPSDTPAEPKPENTTDNSEGESKPESENLEQPKTEPESNLCSAQEENKPQDAAAEEKGDDAKSQDATASDVKPADDAAPAEGKAQPKAQETNEEKQERLEATQARITKENQRKIDTRKEKMDAAQKKVSELNARFADWYYVVSDADYRKLKLSKEQLVQDKQAAGAPAGGPPTGLPNFQFPQLPGAPR